MVISWLRTQRVFQEEPPQTHIINELYNSLESNPDDTIILEQILETWIELGDKDSAEGTAARLISLDPYNERAQRCLQRTTVIPGPSTASAPPPQIHIPSAPTTEAQWTQMEKELENDCKEMKLEATLLSSELKLVSNSAEHTKMRNTLQHIASGRFPSAVSIASPFSVREVARTISQPSNQPKATTLLTADFESVVHWMQLKKPAPSADTIRARLVKRKTLFESTLPPSLFPALATAFATTERNYLQKRYANDETMITGEPLSSIPPDLFFVTEDNYAWDISELVSAVSAAGGTMRNPYTKSLFSPTDISAILAHPAGASLRPMREAQHRMRRGFRPTTIVSIDALGKVMLADQSSDARQCREGIDEFLAYVATLPEDEKGALEGFKIPARDRHTGQEYDYSVGEAVRDAKGNTTCFHKVGDFLEQAAGWLRGQGQ